MTAEPMPLPNIQKQEIINYLKEGKRLDGRGVADYRDVEIKIRISKKAEGSCSVKMGETEVYCGIKMGVSAPYPDGPEEGTMMVSAELGPLASEDFEMGPPRINSIELARIIDRGIRESGFIDFKKLCIKEGEKVWTVFIDLYPINDDGNLLDAAGLAALIALGQAKMPVYDEETDKIDFETHKGDLPLNKDVMSFNTTFFKIGDNFIIDPTSEEELASDFRISIAVGSDKGKPRITAIQKGESVALSQEDFEKVLELVEKNFKAMFPKIEKYVWGK